jgi:predicted phosphoribosyltransferase
MFRNRKEAGQKLAAALAKRSLENPLVLAIPRGGLVIGAVLARELGAELDVVLSRKLCAPRQPELAIGAVSEDGEAVLNEVAGVAPGVTPTYIIQERRRQMEEIRRRQELFRPIRPAAAIAGRSVIVTDDGIATGATMLAALHSVRAKQPKEMIVAVPVASPHQLETIRRACDEVICLSTPARFQAVGQFYGDFPQLSDAEVIRIFRAAGPQPPELPATD